MIKIAPARRARKARPNPPPASGRGCPHHEARITYIDYKDTNLLRKFISDRGKIRSRRVTLPQPSAGGAPTTVQQQNAMARAIKNAREMALLPYVSGAPTAVKAGR